MNACNLLAIGALVALSGCDAVKSSIQYTKGSQCLEQGNYAEAIPYLEESVELFPDMARNHNNLAFAYMKTGNWEGGWRESRKAVLCKDFDKAAQCNFLAAYKVMVVDNHLDVLGTPYDVIISKLGEPDKCVKRPNGNTRAGYGLCLMAFTNDQLSELNILLLP